MTDKSTSDQDRNSNSAYQWDIFISHATEDKQDIALPLARMLEERGIRVWIDKGQINLADNLRKKVNQGITKSRYAAVILTSKYFDKKWTMDELDAFLSREEAGTTVVIPIIHEIDSDILKEQYPLLANRIHSSTTQGLDVVADNIMHLVLKPDSGSPSNETPSLGRRFLNLIESTTDPAEIRQFLGYHPNIIIHALGGDKNSAVKLIPDLNNFKPDLCVSNFLPTPSRNEWFVIQLNSLSPKLFLGDSEPIQSIQKAISDLNMLRSWMGNHYTEVRELLPDITSEFRAVIVAGRRKELAADENQRRWLEDYNDMLFGVRIRTYDWLADTALAM